jgi:chromosome segregation ATPase
MSETTDLEQIAALEQRITTALDRIARGVAARGAVMAPGDAGSGETTGELEERLEALSAALEETQAALHTEQSANAELRERVRAVEAARQADADEAARQLSALTEELDSARAGAFAAPADAADAADDDAASEAIEGQLDRHREVENVLRRRIVRLRDELKAMRKERNAATEQLDEVQGKLDQLQALVDSSAPEASGELARLRDSNRALRDTIDELRDAVAGEGAPDSDLVTAALAAELESLRAERASEAAEARAILSEIRPVLEGGAADA